MTVHTRMATGICERAFVSLLSSIVTVLAGCRPEDCPSPQYRRIRHKFILSLPGICIQRPGVTIWMPCCWSLRTPI